MMNFKINVFGIVRSLIPTKIRNQIHLAWLASLLQPLQELNGKFAFYAKTTRYDLNFNGQIIYLEHVLNNAYDDLLRRIFIKDPNLLAFDNFFIFYEAENQPTNEYVYYDLEGINEPYILSEFDVIDYVEFEVWIPQNILTTPTIPYIKSLINKYKIAGKRYKLIPF